MAAVEPVVAGEGLAAPTTDGGRDRQGPGAGEQEIRRYERSPRDLLHLIVYAALTLALAALTIWVADSVLGFEQDVLRLFDFLSPTVERILHGSLEYLGYALGLIAFSVPLITRRYRLFAYLITANAVALGLMWLVLAGINREEPTLLVNEIASRAGITASTSSGELGFATLSASFVVLAPFVSGRWRRAGMLSIAALVMIRFLVAFHLPGNVVVAIPLGATVGTAVLLAFGRPDRHPTLNAIRRALGAAGLDVADVRAASVDARGSTPYFASMPDGRGLFVKVLGEEERAADLMFRLYRFLRLKDVGDDRPFSSLRRTVEHEALVALAARDVGVRTPRMRGVVRVGDRLDGAGVRA